MADFDFDLIALSRSHSRVLGLRSTGRQLIEFYWRNQISATQWNSAGRVLGRRRRRPLLAARNSSGRRTSHTALRQLPCKLWRLDGRPSAAATAATATVAGGPDLDCKHLIVASAVC
jgi:hypothetical protein